MTQPTARAARVPTEVAIVGAGRVGGAIAAALERRGYPIVAALRRGDPIDPVEAADALVLAVPDEELPAVAEAVATQIRPGTVVVHTSGLHGTRVLRACGPDVAAIHPASPVASPEHSFEGVVFGVTCDEHMRAWCDAFVRDLGGRVRWISEDDRARYHAGLVMASNFTVALAGDAIALGAGDAIVPLMRAAVENIASLGPDAALTGPVVRGDAETIRAHLVSLPPVLHEAYVANTRRACARALAAGRITDDQARRIAGVLEDGGVR